MTLEDARTGQLNYHPNHLVQEIIEHIDLVAVVGITQAGKSALIAELMRLYPGEYHSVVSYTSRAMRPHESPDSMRFIDNIRHEFDEIEQGNYVQYTIHPTKGDLYGTKPDSYDTAKLNLAPMLSGVIEKLSKIGFGQFRTLAIIPEVSGWKTALQQINFQPDELQKRLAEAEQSLHWCINHADSLIWFYKDYGDKTDNARRLHAALKNRPESNPKVIDQAQHLISVIKEIKQGTA